MVSQGDYVAEAERLRRRLQRFTPSNPHDAATTFRALGIKDPILAVVRLADRRERAWFEEWSVLWDDLGPLPRHPAEIELRTEWRPDGKDG